MKSIVHTVIENVECECTSDNTVCGSLGEDQVGEFGEGCLESEEECRWHD